MMTIKNCCCCSVRTACLVFGILGAVFGIFLIYKGVYPLKETKDSWSKIGITKKTIDKFFTVYKAFSIIDFISTIANFLANCCMLFGTLREQEKLLLPTIYFIPIDTVFRLIKLIAFTAVIGFGFSAFLNFGTIMMIIVEFWIWLCAYSHRRELKDGEKTELA